MNQTTWLLLLYALPTPRNAERVNLWRKMKKFGAVQLKTSGYVLPDEPPHLERFQWLSRQIQDAGGEATLMRVAEIDGVSNQEVFNMFNEARAAEYKEVAGGCQQILAKGKRAKTGELSPDLAKLKRRLVEIKAIDYFSSPAGYDAQMLLHRVELELSSPKDRPTVRKLETSAFLGKTWLTRPRPGIDRAGSAWVIRKFIDPRAKFAFGRELARHPGTIPFDMEEGEFSHHGEDCTFETLVKRFRIPDQAVLKMSEMVHDADLEDEKFGRTECLGINSVLAGWARRGLSDEELLSKGMECFEGLYWSLTK